MREWINKITPVDGEDLERHDKWLCMMWPRLQLLHELLADDGVIFISIDDNEQHHLRAIMDEVFGEGNLVANIVWRKKAGGGQDSHYFAVEHDYVVVFRKSAEFSLRLRHRTVQPSEYPRKKNGRACKFLKLEKWGAGSYREDAPSLYYSIRDPDGNDFYPAAPNGADGRWRTKPEKLDIDHIEWIKRKGRWVPYEVIYLDEVGQDKPIKERTIFYDIASTTDAAREQSSIMEEQGFGTAKPVGIIDRILRIATGPNDIVLDSFAGSGTTAHAVLQLNKEDGGNRKFILVECEDYADNITAERVRRVIKGVPNARDATLREGLGGSFTYCTLGKPITMQGMLNGQNLPEYSSLASYLLHCATGMSVNPNSIATNSHAKDHDTGFFYESEHVRYHLLYKQDIEWLRDDKGALNYERAKEISEYAKDTGKSAVVFAPMRYISQSDLTSMHITFCQLPYELTASRAQALEA